MKYRIFILLLFIHVAGWSQTNVSTFFPLPETTVIPVPFSTGPPQFLGQLNGYSYATQEDYSIYPSRRLYQYDQLLHFVRDLRVYPLFKDPAAPIISNDIYCTKNSLLQFTNSRLSTSAGYINHLEIQHINPDNLEKNGTPLIVESNFFKKSKDELDYRITFSEDLSLFCIYSYSKIKGSADWLVSLKVVDENFSTVWEKKFPITLSDKRPWGKLNFHLENNGDVFLTSEEPKSSKNSFTLYSVTGNGTLLSPSLIRRLPSMTIDVHQCKETQDGYLTVLGEYYKTKKNSGMEKDTNGGACFFRINLATNQTEVVKFLQLVDYFPELRLDLAQRPADFNLAKILETPDQKSIFIFEYRHKQNQVGGPMTTYGDLLAMKVDQQGNVEWSRRIPKFQYTTGSTDLLSFQAAYSDALYLVFNQFADKNYYNAIARVSDDGIVQQRPLFENYSYAIVPVDGKAKATGHQMLLSASSVKPWLHTGIANDFYDKGQAKNNKNIPVNSSHDPYIIKLDFDQLSFVQPQEPVFQGPVPDQSQVAQQQAKHYEQINNYKLNGNNNHYIGLFVLHGMSNNHWAPGTASANFAYFQRDASASSLTLQNAAFSKNYSTTAFPEIGIGFEYVQNAYYGDIKITTVSDAQIFNSDINRFYDASVGTGFRHYFSEKRMGVRLGGMLLLNNTKNQLGSLDNNNQVLQIAGHYFNPTFSKYQHHTTNQYNADYDLVGIKQTSYGIAPKIGFEYYSKNNHWIYRVNVGYYFNLTRTNHMFVQQVNKGTDTKSDDTNINPNILHYQYQGNNSSGIPFSTNGVFINFELVLK